jgi:hypothetical protein
MDEFARRPAPQRAEVFAETATRQGIGRAAIVEKDFWVCWTLLQLRDFFEQRNRPNGHRDAAGLLFKGGTSLSKVYGVIRRFSEDIDLTIDRETLGFVGETEPGSPELSANKRKKLFKDLAREAEAYVAETIAPYLGRCLAALPAMVGDQRGSSGSLVGVEIDPDDHQALRLAYPRALEEADYGSAAYVRAEVKLEFGARGELWPAHRARVRPYVAVEFPQLFATAEAEVNVLDLARTLWEKATILHQIAHAGVADSRERLSRHYYDLAQLIATDEGKAALQMHELLARVAEYKRIFYPQAKARYELARAGSLRLIPNEDTLAHLRRDYQEMREMFFEDPPSFDVIIEALRKAEVELNSV